MAADDTTIRYDYCAMSSEALMAIGAVLIASGATTFGICIAMLVGANERPIVATLPLAEGQWVTLDAAGPYMLRGDSGGTFTFVFVGLRYTLQSADGAQVVGYRPLTHGGMNGVPLWGFNVPAAGAYYLRVWGLSDRDVAKFKVMFARLLPFKGWGYIGGIAIGVVAFLGGLLMMIWRG
jgi:hypothetical protein